MATPKHWGHRFTSQVWGFFKRNFRVNPSEMKKSDMTTMLKQKRGNKELFGKMDTNDRQMLSRLIGRDGKSSKLWGGHLWSDIKSNTRNNVVISKRGTPFLRYKWTKNEEMVVQRNISSPKVAYAALGSTDSPHNYNAVRIKAFKLKARSI